MNEKTAVEKPAEQPQLPAKAPAREPITITERGLELRSFEDLWRFSTAVAASGLAPKGVDKVEAIAVAIQMGLEVGLTPMAALQNIAVINGRPAIWGDAQLAVVRATGKLALFEECETNNEIDLIFRQVLFTEDQSERQKLRLKIAQLQSTAKKDAPDYGFTCAVRRAGSEDISFSRFTIADARTANLWAKSGPWTQYPARMLRFRARSFNLRDNFGDALKGMLSVEEVRDIHFEHAKRVQGTVADVSQTQDQTAPEKPSKLDAIASATETAQLL